MIVVSVLMPTYNHASFIAEAIDSFLCQKIDFDVELLIGDDCSSDMTSLIAQDYAQRFPDKIRFFRYAENRGLLRNYQYLLNQAKGKYVAILESDDVWIDCNKLKKQVDAIETVNNCGMVFSNWLDIDNRSKEISRSHTPMYNLDYPNLLRGNFVAAVTVLFSREMFDKYCDINDYIALGFKTLDYPVWLSISAHARVVYLDDYTAGYRHLASSISNNNDYQKALSFEKSVDNIVGYIVEKYGAGGLSKKELKNTQTYRYIILALRFNKIRLAMRKMIVDLYVVDLRTFIMKYFPWLWILRNKRLIGIRK